MSRKILWVLAAAVVFWTVPAPAEDKGGIRVEVTAKTLDRNDGRDDGYFKEINRMMTLKMKVTNVSMKPLAEQNVEYVIIVQRWSSFEVSSYDRITGSVTVPALAPTKNTEVTMGEYRIGGHLHGTSRRHLDELAAWKVKFTPAAVEFRNTAQFDTLEKRATTPTR